MATSCPEPHMVPPLLHRPTSPSSPPPFPPLQNLDKSIDNKALHDTFSQFGLILSCKVATDATGQSKGYGFVHFETEEGANLAIEKVNGMQLADKIVFVGPFLKRVERGASDSKYTNVYVKNLSEDIDEDGLKALAGEYGEVQSVIIMKVRHRHKAPVWLLHGYSPLARQPLGARHCLPPIKLRLVCTRVCVCVFFLDNATLSPHMAVPPIRVIAG